MRALVTGGAGFIGGHEVTVIDNFEPFYDLGIKDRNVEACRTTEAETDATYELVKASITDESKINSLVEDTDVIYNQAAQAGVRISVDQPKKVNAYNRRWHDRTARGGLTTRHRPRNHSLFVVRLRQTRIPPLRRGPPDNARLTVWRIQTRNRTVCPRVPRSLLPADSLVAVLYGVRSPDAPEHGDDVFCLTRSARRTTVHLR